MRFAGRLQRQVLTRFAGGLRRVVGHGGRRERIGDIDVLLCAFDTRSKVVEHVALRRVAGDKVERMDYPSLADAIDPSHPLLQTGRIPRQLGVNDDAAAMVQVQAASGRICRQQETARAVDDTAPRP